MLRVMGTAGEAACVGDAAVQGQQQVPIVIYPHKTARFIWQAI